MPLRSLELSWASLLAAMYRVHVMGDVHRKTSHRPALADSPRRRAPDQYRRATPALAPGMFRILSRHGLSADAAAIHKLLVDRKATGFARPRGAHGLCRPSLASWTVLGPHRARQRDRR